MLSDYAKAIDPSTSVSELEELALNSDPRVVEGVCYNPSTSADILTVCAVHSHLNVTIAVACHANTPEDILTSFTTHAEWVVRYNLAVRKATISLNLQNILKRDENANVRQGLASRFDTDASVLSDLASDVNTEVSGAAQAPRIDLM